jgi:hypothetical protein
MGGPLISGLRDQGIEQNTGMILTRQADDVSNQFPTPKIFKRTKTTTM